MTTLRKQLFEKGEPVREKVLEYCYEQKVPTNALTSLCQLTNAESGFDSMDKLKLTILALEELEDMLLMDKVTGAITPNQYNFTLRNRTNLLLELVAKLHSVVSNAKKYENYNHLITVTYESKLKEKDNA